MLNRNSFKGLLVVALAVVALGTLAGCDGGDSSASSSGGKVTPKAGSTVDATVGKDFVVRLKSNPTTGYQWSVKQAGAGVRFIASTYEAPKQDAAGAPGQQLLKFEATKAGTWKVDLAYERPFAPDEPGKALSFSVDAAKA